MHDNDLLSFPSKLTGNVLRLLLLIAVIIYTLVAICTVFYVVDYEFYHQVVAAIDEPAMLFGGILYYIIVVMFLIWIIQVHRALKQRHPSYPISVTGGIVRLLPIVNVWGIGSTFANISDYLTGNETLDKAAYRVQRMIFPLYFVIFIGNGLNRYILRNPLDVSDAVIMAGALLDLISVVVYWLLAQTIHRAVTYMYTMAQEEALEEAAVSVADET